MQRNDLNTRLADLLCRAGQGDAAAFRRLHGLVGGILSAYALRFVRKQELAEEVIQESLIAIWREAARFNPALSAPLTWMTRIVRNKAIDFIRAADTRQSEFDEAVFLAVHDPAIGPCEILEMREQNLRIRRGLAKLDGRQREAIELAFFQDMSHIEVAQAMTIPLGTVKTWIRRGCQQLRRDMTLIEQTQGNCHQLRAVSFGVAH